MAGYVLYLFIFLENAVIIPPDKTEGNLNSISVVYLFYYLFESPVISVD